MNAQQAVGTQEANDWLLKPRAHADALPEEADPLKKILTSDAVTPIMECYDEADSKAQAYQKSYQKWGRCEIYLTVAATVIGSLLLYISDYSAGSEKPADILHMPSLILVLLQAISLAGIAVATYMQRSGGFFKKWMQERTKAEEARIELFETVCGLRETLQPVPIRENEIPLLPLQLEYFRRYQLEVQINYYKGRGKQHGVAAKRLLSRGAIIVFFGALAGAIASSATTLGNWVNGFAIMGVITPALLGAQGKFSLLSQDERNAFRYAITLDHLREYQKRLEIIRHTSENNEFEKVRNFIKSVHEIISVENKQWKEQRGHIATETEDRRG